MLQLLKRLSACVVVFWTQGCTGGGRKREHIAVQHLFLKPTIESRCFEFVFLMEIIAFSTEQYVANRCHVSLELGG